MAAGGCNASRKRYFHHSKAENHRRANGYRNKSLKTCRDHLFVDLSLLSSRNLDGGNDGRRQREGFVDRYFNKDHGDLHVPRDSIEASDLESQARVSGVTKLADATGDKNKRKFSPILWDRDDKEVIISSRIKVVRRSSPSSSPSVPQSAFPLPTTRCPVTAKIQDLQNLPAEPHVANGSPETYISKAASDLVAPLSSEPYGSNFPEHENVEEEEYVKERNISTSKWANVDSSPLSPCTSSSSPESGEFYREGFEETKKKSGSAKAGGFAEPASEDDHSVNGLEDYDYMEIDEKCQKVDDDEVPKHKGINMLEGCRSVFKYEKLNKINEGTYGVVYRAKDKETGEIVALKKVKMAAETEGFPVTSLREINILMSIHHQSVVEVKEVVMDELDGVFMVMEYMEHDLKGLLEVMKQPFSQSEVKCLMLQLLEGVKALHDNWVLHRDLKTSNLLLNNRGELKICDFGMSRQYGSPLKPYTPLVVTLWYRAPEILLGAKQYSTAIDMWSVGCIMAELLAKEPLFSGKTELDQLDKIFRTLGTPSEMIWPGFSNLPGAKASFVKQPYNMLRKKFPAATFTGSPVLTELGFDLLNKLLTYDPNERITAEEALNHGWFKEVPLPKSKDFMPTFPAQVAKPCKPITHRKRA